MIETPGTNVTIRMNDMNDLKDEEMILETQY